MSVTLQQVADHLGVSRMAVSYALRDQGKISLDMRRRIKATAAELGYRPNAAARSMVTRSTGIVGILVANHNTPTKWVTHPALYEAVLGLNHALDAEDYVSAIVPLSDLPQPDRRLPRVFREQMLDAMVVLGAMPEDVQDAVRQVARKVIWADAMVWESTHCIRRDESAAGAMAVEKAADRGYRRIAFTVPTTPEPHYSLGERLAGAQRAADRRGLDVQTVPLPEWKKQPDLSTIEPHIQPDTCLLASAAYHAQWLISQIGLPGIVTGRTFGLACCESNEQLRRSTPQFSHVEFNRYDFGRQVARMVVQLLADPPGDLRSQLVRSNWHEGSTLRPADGSEFMR